MRCVAPRMICGILLIMSVAHVAARRPRIPWLRDGQFRVAWLLTLVAGIAIIKFWRVGPDWPAQEFRSWLVHTAGLQVWNNAWYGGHALPGAREAARMRVRSLRSL